MSHFAQIDDNNVVIRVIVAEQEFIDSGLVGDPSKWIQTSYNTYEGVHLNSKEPLRKNYACPGYTYDPVRDAFIPEKIYDSWVFDEFKCVYVPPFDKPDTGREYEWDETIQNWKDITISVATPIEVI